MNDPSAANRSGAVPTITYTLTDADGATDTATLNISVTAVDDPPVIIDPANPGPDPNNPTPVADPANIIPDVTNDENVAITPIDVSTYVTSVDPANTFTYAATGLPDGINIDPVTGILSGPPTGSTSQGGPASDGVYPVVITITGFNG